MYNVERHLDVFDTEDDADRARYEAVINNPLCSIIREIKQVLADREIDGEGVVHIHEHLVLIVTWEEKCIS